MPLSSTELHRLARSELGPLLAPLGFRRSPGTSMASWARPADDRWVVLWVQPWRGTDAYAAGARFTVELRLSDAPAPGGGGLRRRLTLLLTDAEREEMRRLQNRVIAKLPPPDAATAQLLPPAAREHWLREWKPRLAPYGRDEDVWFRHGVEDDVRAWLAFFARVLPGAIDRFVESSLVRPAS